MQCHPEQKSQPIDPYLATALTEEIEILRQLTQFFIERDGANEAVWSRVFPKKCNNCETIYWNRNSYVMMTNELEAGGFVCNDLGIQEYRNCKCGSTLLIRVLESRDKSIFGQKRRALFERCLKKVMAEKRKEDQREMCLSLRLLFRNIIATEYALIA